MFCAALVFAAPYQAERLIDSTNDVADARSLATTHAALASEPHIAGTPGDERVIERLTETFRALGLEVEVHRIAPLLCRPIDARLEILGEVLPTGARRGVVSLDLRERNLLEDPATAHPDLTYGWNAYSGSGDVTAGVVYANYGTRADFARLVERGVSVKGKIVLARYGGNFRGYKAKFAEEAGAVGLLIYTDPADSGFARGATWPAGGWANDTCVQRGSLVTLPWPGDPLTPGIEATATAPRMEQSALALPKIPVQPIGYAAAERIMARMDGTEIIDEQSPDKAWIGGIKQPYRFEGGDGLQLRLVVRQERFIGNTANVIATLRGAKYPDEMVVVGCHHDAWGFGAADPLAGTMVLVESARSFAEAAKKGIRPDRTIVFAAWGAEEFGIIGSTEWVERHREALQSSAVAYINLDMAAMGDSFGASASPALRSTILAATQRAVSPFDGQPVYDRWASSKAKAGDDGDAAGRVPTCGDLGGGSDHVGFWCHAGVPCISLGAGGSPGTSYHSNYDTVAWYRTIVGEDYNSALMITRVNNAVVALLASGEVWPDDPASVVRDTLRLLGAARTAAAAGKLQPAVEKGIEAFAALEPIAERASARLVTIRRDSTGAAHVNGHLRKLRDAWMDNHALPERRWFRNLFAATDRHSGYAPSMLPRIAEAIEDANDVALQNAVARYVRVAKQMQVELEAIAAAN
ncbi:MAG: M28 family peptidase [Phycisphaerae bacterium]|nr:M28 family peptidase [Phycisphaerae bacterium]